MQLSQQVCSLEQAKRLKELGINQDAVFSWCGDQEMRLLDYGKDGVKYSNWTFVSNTHPINNMEADYRDDVPSAKPFAAAYSCAELGVMLNATIIGATQSGELIERNWHDDIEQEGFGLFDTEAQARAALLIKLLESGTITAAECNERLKS